MVVRWNPEVGIKDVAYIVALVAVLGAGWTRMEMVASTTQETVKTLRTITAQLDSRVGDLELKSAVAAAYEQGRIDAMTDQVRGH